MDAPWTLAETADPRGVRLREVRHTPGSLGEDPDVEDVIALSAGRRLLCRACAEPVTADAHRVAVEGRNVHLRTNPAGFDYEFACFGVAAGAVAVGEATDEHTWFAGFTWRIAICRACGFHLGWLFEGATVFYGLILNRLEAERQAD